MKNAIFSVFVLVLTSSALAQSHTGYCGQNEACPTKAKTYEEAQKICNQELASVKGVYQLQADGTIPLVGYVCQTFSGM